MLGFGLQILRNVVFVFVFFKGNHFYMTLRVQSMCSSSLWLSIFQRFLIACQTLEPFLDL